MAISTLARSVPVRLLVIGRRLRTAGVLPLRVASFFAAARGRRFLPGNVPLFLIAVRGGRMRYAPTGMGDNGAMGVALPSGLIIRSRGMTNRH